jgi:dolichol-phosphate mannosyltransferase
MTITEPGYGMPLELWVQAAHLGLRIVEVPVPLIYLDEKRSFGGNLDDGRKRLEYYHRVLDNAVAGVAPPRREPECLFDMWDDSACNLPCGHGS